MIKMKAAMTVVARETGQTRCHFLGESSGALRAAAFAVAAPEHAGRLVLAALSYTGKGSPTLAKRAEQVEYYRTHNTLLRDRAMIESISPAAGRARRIRRSPRRWPMPNWSMAIRCRPGPIST
jgi:pimeloyl-ACP methyl ester carboxylesterase